MWDIEKAIRERRSVRTFEERSIPRKELDQLFAILADSKNPYGLPVEFKVLDSSTQKLSCPVVVGTDCFVGAKLKKTPFANEAFGYSFELFVLYAQALGLGTVWVGGTMDRSAFENAMDLADSEFMPCMSPLGYPAAKMSVRETLMRKGIKADDRLPFEALFFDETFNTPLTKAKAGQLAFPLEMVRLAPSAVNRQPWRIVVSGNMVHFYLKRSKGFSGGELDMQKIDMGIAMCHFDLAAQKAGLSPVFTQAAPDIAVESDLTYIASYTFSDPEYSSRLEE